LALPLAKIRMGWQSDLDLDPDADALFSMRCRRRQQSTLCLEAALRFRAELVSIGPSRFPDDGGMINLIRRRNPIYSTDDKHHSMCEKPHSISAAEL
jgi:hypothetical protein